MYQEQVKQYKKEVRKYKKAIKENDDRYRVLSQFDEFEASYLMKIKNESKILSDKIDQLNILISSMNKLDTKEVV